VTRIRVVLPVHLRRLAGTPAEVSVEVVEATPSLADVLTALESDHPVLVGAIRDPVSGKRRPFVRYFACERDLSHEPPADPLPAPVLTAAEPLLIVGAMAGG
jgi:hypothetical protein